MPEGIEVRLWVNYTALAVICGFVISPIGAFIMALFDPNAVQNNPSITHRLLWSEFAGIVFGDLVIW